MVPIYGESQHFPAPPLPRPPPLFSGVGGGFGGAVTLHSRERSLDLLRQTGSVSDLAIAFKNITHTFNPRWPDHPLIYLFSRKLRETIRFELTARGSLPSTFHAYLAAAISVEQNQAAAASSRSQPSSKPPPRPPPRALPLPAPPPGHQTLPGFGLRSSTCRISWASRNRCTYESAAGVLELGDEGSRDMLG